MKTFVRLLKNNNILKNYSFYCNYYALKHKKIKDDILYDYGKYIDSNYNELNNLKEQKKIDNDIINVNQYIELSKKKKD